MKKNVLQDIRNANVHKSEDKTDFLILIRNMVCIFNIKQEKQRLSIKKQTLTK